MIKSEFTNEQKKNTKDIILDVALLLFSRHGYDGTSIRNIAQQAGVNVAAVNYHFKTKHNLYWAAMQSSHLFLQDQIALMSETAKNIEELTIKTFQFVFENRLIFRNTVKMMLNENIPDPDGEYLECGMNSSEVNGPPGADFFARKLKEEFGNNISPSNLQWAVQSIFGAFFHWAVICSTSKYEVMKEKDSSFSLKEIEAKLARTVRAITKSL